MNENLPQFLYEKLVNQYGENLALKIVEGYSKKRPVTLRVNTIKSSCEEVIEELQKANIEFEQLEWYKDAIIIKEKSEQDIRNLKIYEEGKIYLQSLSSMLPVLVLDPKEDENILDMAAAPGGKTTQMMAYSDNKAFITACEKNKVRAERLKYNLEKQGASRVNVLVEDARNLSNFLSYDKVLLDAPCSGSGTIELENPKLKQVFTEDLVERSTKVQYELLNKALNILKKGSEMVYSTCSILKEENENHLKKLLEKKKIEIVPIDVNKFNNLTASATNDDKNNYNKMEYSKDLPLLPVDIEGTACIYPNELYEGFFIAKIRKI